MWGKRAVVVPVSVALLFSLALLPWLPGTAADEPTVHVVRWGETQARIARQYGVTLDALEEANGLEDRNVIYAGQRLIIPAMPESVVVHTVQPGESLLSIAHQYGVSIRELAQRNYILNINLVFVGERLVIPGVDEEPTLVPTRTPISVEPPQVREAIIITTPTEDERVSSPVTVTGWGSGFENTLAVDVLDEWGNRIGQGFVTVDADVGQFGPFDGKVEFTPPSKAQSGRVQVYRISPRDGAIEHLSSVTVQLRP